MMIFSITEIVIFSIISYTLWNAICLLRNYLIARKVGVKVLVCPINGFNPFMLIFNMSFGDYVEPYYTDGMLVSTLGWTAKYRYKLHQKYGMAFIVCTPGQIALTVADGAAIKAIFADPKTFVKPGEVYDLFKLFGHNVATTNGDKWVKHRRLTSPPFNERNSELVWTESLTQGATMLNKFLESGSVTETREFVQALALNVLCSAGLGLSTTFMDEAKNNTLSFRYCLTHTADNLFSGLALPLWARPKSLTTSLKQLDTYLRQLVQKERENLELGITETDGTLMNVLLKESEKAGKSALTDEEIRSNLWVYTFAGHDTSANTITNTLYLLASHPDVQDWIREEILEVCPSNQKVEDWNYKELYPKLKRCLAVMHETLRLYGPLDSIPRMAESDAKISVYLQPSDKTATEITIPAKINVYPTFGITQCLPNIWGSDCLDWRPSRWMDSSPNTSENFFPWVAGPRICPGVKFSKVEFAAVLAALFRNHRVEIVKKIGETQTAAEKRVLNTVIDVEFKPTKKMKNVRSVKLKWVTI